MTMIPPGMLRGVGFGAYSRPDVQPFTFRDAITYTELQERIKEYVLGLADQVNGSMAGLEGVVDAYFQKFSTGAADVIGPVLLNSFGSSVFSVAPLPLGGGQDDTTNLNNALKSSGTVLIRPGTYSVNGTVYVYANARTHVLAYGAVFDYAAGSGSVVRIKNAAHLVEGLTLVGNGSTDGSSGFLNYADNVVIRNNVIQSMGRFAISNSGGNNVIITNNKTDSTSQSTAMSDAPSVAAIISDNGSHVVVSHNICTNTRWGITMRSDSSTQNIFACLVEGNYIACDPAIAAADTAGSTQGLSAGWTEHLKTVNNTIYGYSGNAIDHHGSHHDVITGNTISRCNSDGIFVGDYDGTPAGTFGTTPSRVTSGTVISGNALMGVGTGIRVFDGAQYVTVTGNSIDNFYVHGIQVRGGPAADPQNIAVNNITVTGNVINSENNATGVGIWVTDCSVALIGQNQINRPGTYGVLVDNGSDMVRIENNAIQGSGYKQTAGQMDAVWTNCSRTFVRGNTFYGGNGVAINIAGGQNSTISGNRFRSITGGGPITDNGTTTTQSDNLSV